MLPGVDLSKISSFPSSTFRRRATLDMLGDVADGAMLNCADKECRAIATKDSLCSERAAQQAMRGAVPASRTSTNPPDALAWLTRNRSRDAIDDRARAHIQRDA